MTKRSITHIKHLALIAGAVLGLLLFVQVALGSNIDPTGKYAWSANAGWIDFAPAGYEGVTVYADHLEGYAWGENVGWIRMGTHTGGGSHTYANTTKDDYGVNVDGSGNLSGYAWGASVGWINFAPANGGVTIDTATGEFDGYAWGENVGWIRCKGTADDSTEYNIVANLIDLKVAKSVTPTTDVAYHGTLTYTVVLSNSGTFSDTNVLFTDTLPAEVDFASWVEQPSGTSESGDEITWSGTVPAGEAITWAWTVTHTGDYLDVVTNTAAFSGTQQMGTAEARFTAQDPPDVGIVKAVTPTTPVGPGGRVTYTLTFSNAGLGTATGVVITDLVPISVTNTSVVSSGNALSPMHAITQTNVGIYTYTWGVQDLAQGQGGVITITGVLSDLLPAGHIFTNTAVITTTTTDSDASNDSSSAGVMMAGGQPDNLVRVEGNAGWEGDDVHNLDASGQVTGTSAGPESNAVYRVQIQGEDYSDSYNVKGNGGGGGWTVKYYRADNGNDITADVIDGGWNTGIIGVGASVEITVSVEPDWTPDEGTIHTVTITSTSNADSTKRDVARADTTVDQAGRPDGEIEVQGGSFTGDGTYNSDGTNQTVSDNTSVNTPAVYRVRFENDGNGQDSFDISGTSSGSGWNVGYYDDGGSPISLPWSTGNLARDEAVTITVEVTPTVTPNGGASYHVLVTATSDHDSAVDAVAADTTVDDYLRPDLEIKRSTDPPADYLTDDVYEDPVSTQITRTTVCRGTAAVYHLRVGNDGNTTDNSLLISGDGGNAQWDVKYYDGTTGGTDITTQVTGGGWTVSPGMARGATTEIRVEVTPLANATTASPYTVDVTASSGGASDEVRSITTVQGGQPDNLVRVEGNPGWEGSDVYSPTSQITSTSTGPQTAAVYRIQIQGENCLDSYQVTEDADTCSTGWTVQYYRAGTPLGSSVNWNTGDVSVGAHEEITVSVTPGWTLDAGDSCYLGVLSTSDVDPTKQDLVRATTTVEQARRPDEWIRAELGGSWNGDDTYNSDASGQSVGQNTDLNTPVSYTVTVENDGNDSDTFTITGDGGDANWDVGYYDVSGSPLGLSWSTGSLARGETISFTVVVTPLASATGGSTRQTYITATGGTVEDVVLANTTVNSEYMVDGQIKLSSEGSYSYDDVYKPAAQKKSGSVERNVTLIYHLRVENDGDTADTYDLTRTYGDANWTVVYYDAQTGGSVVNPGDSWNTGSLNPGEVYDARVEVTPGDHPPVGGTSWTVWFTATSQAQRSVAEDSAMDTVQAETTVEEDYQPDNHVRVEGNPGWEGEDVHNISAAGQTTSTTTALDTAAVYRVRIENDGNSSDSFNVTGTGDGAGWDVEYYSGGSRIALPWSTGSLAVGASVEITLSVTPGIIPDGGDVYPVYITSTAQSDVNDQDVVCADTTVNEYFNPDMEIKLDDAGDTYVGNSIYNADGASQSKTDGVTRSVAAIYHLRIGNDGNATDSNIVITGTAGTAEWDVAYYDAASGGTDVTAQVTGSSGWSVPSLARDTTRVMRVEVTPLLNATTAAPYTVYARASRGGAVSDTVRAETTAVGSQPDNEIKETSPSPGSYVGNTIINTSGVNQTVEGAGDANVGVTYLVKVVSEEGLDNFTITGTAGIAHWAVTYHDASNGNNITSQMTGAGWKPDIAAGPPAGSGQEISVTVVPDWTPDGGDTFTVSVLSTSNIDPGKEDLVRAATTVNSEHIPDGWIRAEDGLDVYHGDDAHNNTASGQTTGQATDRNAPVSYTIAIQNDGNVADNFHVTGDGGDANWDVGYYDSGGGDITAGVLGGTWSTGNLARDAAISITLVVTPGTWAVGGVARHTYVTATRGGIETDVVLADTTVRGTVMADSQIKLSTAGSFSYDNVYNPTDQTETGDVDRNAVITYHLRIENDGNQTDVFTGTGTGGGSGWTVAYYDAATGGSDVTAGVLGGTWTTGNMGPGISHTLRVEVSPGASVYGETDWTVEFTATSGLSPTTVLDTVAARTIVNADYQPDPVIDGTGDDVYDPPDEQKSSLTRAPNPPSSDTAIYDVRLENDGNVQDSFMVQGDGDSGGWSVEYYSGTLDITDDVIGGGWNSGNLDKDDALDLEVRVSQDHEIVPAGDVFTAILTTTSNTETDKRDQVEAETTADTYYQPDNMVISGTVVGADVWNVTGVNQTLAYTIELDSGTTVISHEVFIENDGNAQDSFVISGTDIAMPEWTVEYYSGTVDVTANVLAGTLNTGPLARQGQFKLVVKMSLVGIYRDISGAVNVTSTSDANQDRQDMVVIRANVVGSPAPVGGDTGALMPLRPELVEGWLLLMALVAAGAIARPKR